MLSGQIINVPSVLSMNGKTLLSVSIVFLMGKETLFQAFDRVFDDDKTVNWVMIVT